MVDYLNVAFVWIGFIFTELFKFVGQIFNAISLNTIPMLLGAFTLYTIGRVLLAPFLGHAGHVGSDTVKKMRTRRFLNRTAPSAQIQSNHDRIESRRF